jgi:hypothetical protein
MDIRAALIADPQSTILRQPRQGALHDPPVNTQPTPVWCSTFGQHGNDTHGAQEATVRLRIIATVALHLVRTASRSSRFAPHRGDRLKQRQQLGDVMAVGACHQGRQRYPVGIRHQMMFAARFAPIRGIGTGFFPRRLRRERCGYPPWRETSRVCRRPGAWRATRHEAGATHQCGARPANAASTSCQRRSPSPGGASPRGSLISAQREYPSVRFGRVPVADRLWAWETQAVIRAR